MDQEHQPEPGKPEHEDQNADGSEWAAVPARGGTRRRWAPRRASSAEGPVLREDGALELPQLLARLDAQFVDERSTRILIGPERLGLAPGAVEGEHQLGA